jgi:hypothetical protein
MLSSPYHMVVSGLKGKILLNLRSSFTQSRAGSPQHAWQTYQTIFA